MALIGDSGAIYALYDADDRHHRGVCSVVREDPGPIIVPSPILGELDYLLRVNLGIDADLSFLSGIRSGGFVIEPFTSADLVRCSELIADYRDLDLGLADASVIATAERLDVNRILTVYERDFRAIRPRGFGRLVLLPADR